MEIELTSEIENALRAEASAQGVSASDVTLRVLADYAGSRSTSSASDASDASELRHAAVQRLVDRAQAADAPRLDLPEGLSIREWLHVGHQY